MSIVIFIIIGISISIIICITLATQRLVNLPRLIFYETAEVPKGWAAL